MEKEQENEQLRLRKKDYNRLEKGIFDQKVKLGLIEPQPCGDVTY